VALAPALRACLTGEPPDTFATAVTETAGATTVRYWRAGRVAVDCEIAADGGGVVQARRLVPGAPSPEAAAPAFFLERRCVDARRVDSADGTVLGWLAYPAC
jgi:hypothetical protein